MLLAIPYQTLEVGKVHIDNFRIDRKGRSIAPLSYKDASVDIGDLTLLMPELPIARVDVLRPAAGTPATLERGRIVLDVASSPVFQAKLNALQEYIAASLYLHRMTFFGKDSSVVSSVTSNGRQGLADPPFRGIGSVEEIKSLLQPLLIDSHLYLYTYATTRSTPFRVSEQVKLIVRIHGILKVDVPGRSTPLLRIQHTVLVQP
jgi:hypothetical protein